MSAPAIGTPAIGTPVISPPAIALPLPERIALPFVVFTSAYAAAFLVARRALRPLDLRRESVEIVRLRESMPNVTVAQLTHAHTALARLSTAIGVLQGPLYLALLGITVWGFARVAGAHWTLRTALRTIVSAGGALVARQIGLAIGAFASDLGSVDAPNQLSLGPARYVRPDSGLLALLSSLDIFSLVLVVLLAALIFRATGLSRRRAIGVAFISWAVWLAPSLL